MPGLMEANRNGRDDKFAKWPYYAENGEPIKTEDDVVAMAIVIAQGLHADDNVLDHWLNNASLQDKHGYDPRSFLSDCLTDFKDPKNQHRHRDIALKLESVAKGEIKEALSLYESLKDALAPFAAAAEKIHWPTYAYWPCAD